MWSSLCCVAFAELVTRFTQLLFLVSLVFQLT